MTNFEEVFRSTIESTNKAFSEADADVHSIVLRASDALLSVTEGAFLLELDERDEDLEGRVYDLDVVTSSDPDNRITIFALRIPPRGLPLEIGLYKDEASFFRAKTKLESTEDLAEYIGGIAQRSDSSFLKFITLNMRAKDDETAPESS